MRLLALSRQTHSAWHFRALALGAAILLAHAPFALSARADDTKAPASASASPSTESSARKSKTHEGATRVAILNFGPPESWQGTVGSLVGGQIRAAAFKAAIPLLEKDKVDVAVIRVNSGGGALSELQPFQDVFEQEYKPRFRTVAWIESAISAAAMSPYVIEEMYFMRKGNLGACTGWFGDLKNVEGVSLELVLAQMERASKLGKRDPAIMRAMQIQEPLSVDVDASGNVTWRQDLHGQVVINPANRILTLNASDALKYKFAQGLADTTDELFKALGLQEAVIAGKEASDFIDKSMREADKTEKRFQETLAKYNTAVSDGESLAGDANKKDRARQVGIARRLLSELKRLYEANPLIAGQSLEGGKEWFPAQEARLRKLAT